VVEAPNATRIALDVFDVAGRRVRSLYQGNVAAGSTPFTWDGLDNFAHGASSGVYFVRAQSATVTTTAKIVLVR
jgi:hypothetical protein